MKRSESTTAEENPLLYIKLLDINKITDKKKINGTYTQLLKATLDINMKQYVSNEKLCEILPNIMNTIFER